MPVRDLVTDRDALTLTVTAEFAAPPERVWQVWADPRQLERWWGPPGWPATFTELDPRPGGNAAYVMSGPDGERPHGWWRFLAVQPPHRLEFEDGFADDDGRPRDDMPVTQAIVTLAADGTGTVLTMVSVFPTGEALATLSEMGMEEGMRQAMSQIDTVLAESI